MATRLVARPDIPDRRRESAAHPFGTIKQWMNQGAFLMRLFASVGGEFGPVQRAAIRYDRCHIAFRAASDLAATVIFWLET